jgi:hypothetical protein
LREPREAAQPHCSLLWHQAKRAAFGLAVVLAALLQIACAQPAPPPSPGSRGTAVASAKTAKPIPTLPTLPPKRAANPNPLGLPDSGLRSKKGRRVFAVSQAGLNHARLGSTLILRAARVLEQKGELLRLRVRHGSSYTIHNSYVIAPQKRRFRRGNPVFANYHSKLRHGVVHSLFMRKVAVQYTDIGRKARPARLAHDEVGHLPPGLQPGAYAVYSDGRSEHHVLLVSSGRHLDGSLKWLVLGYGSSARVVLASQLRAIPQRLRLKPGAEVSVAWRGRFVDGVVRSADKRARLFRVKRARSGSTMLVGPGQLLYR